MPQGKSTSVREDARVPAMPFPFQDQHGDQGGCRASDPTSCASRALGLGLYVPFSIDTCDDLGLLENDLLSNASFSLI